MSDLQESIFDKAMRDLEEIEMQMTRVDEVRIITLGGGLVLGLLVFIGFVLAAVIFK